MTAVCCGLIVSESGEGISWILLLLLLHAGVSTTGTGGVSCILSSMMLHTGVSGTGTDDDRGGELCIVFTVCRSINSSFIYYLFKVDKKHTITYFFYNKVAML